MAEVNEPAEVARAIDEITAKPMYKQSTWGISVIDLDTGEQLVARNPQTMFLPGSTMKSYAVAAALDAYGPDQKLTTPVYTQGNNLVIVGAGDFSFGLRDKPDGTLSYYSQPIVDHSYANTGAPGVKLEPGDPYGALDDLAKQVKAKGINSVTGDVVVDNRMFTPIAWPDGVISALQVNENLIDITVTPGAAAGQPSTAAIFPKTSAYQIESAATTATETDLTVKLARPGVLQVTGTIAADGGAATRVYQIEDPTSWGRTAFIEALQRAGVAVAAPATGANNDALLPPKGSYKPSDEVAQHLSATMAEQVKVIMKISYNRAADMMPCLAAVKAGSTNCTDGLGVEAALAKKLGADPLALAIFDGAGSDERNRTTPQPIAQFMRGVNTQSWSPAFFASLPVLGVDGSLAPQEKGKPSVGKVVAKTGTRLHGTEYGQVLLTGLSQAGYIQAKSGRKLAFGVFTRDVSATSMAPPKEANTDQSMLTTALQQGF